MTKSRQAIVINDRDNVATALRTLHADTKVLVDMQGVVQNITIRSDIPMGHKFALKEISEGAPIIKYGEPIGQSTASIAPGDHVHVHNVKSRPREDLP